MRTMRAPRCLAMRRSWVRWKFVESGFRLQRIMRLLFCISWGGVVMVAPMTDLQPQPWAGVHSVRSASEAPRALKSG